MKKTFTILIVLTMPAMSLATFQEPDVLVYDDLTLSLGTMAPSPLETYYYQNRIERPFRSFARCVSSSINRDHVAVWEIVDANLYLTEIRILKNFDFNSIELSFKSYDPSDLGVKSNSAEPNEGGHVLADWFTGILHCYRGHYLVTWPSYYFHVRKGKIVEMQISNWQYSHKPNNNPDATTSGNNLNRRYNLARLYRNYTDYYFRLSERDEIECDEPGCRLDTGYDRLSPIFAFYNNSHLKWPYNWENAEKSGAPHCKWLIEDEKLYLTGVELYSGDRLDRIDTETLDLTTLFDDKVKDGVVWADWVSGVYLIEHGEEEDDIEQEDDISGLARLGPLYRLFNRKTKTTYIRIEQGKILESYTLPKDFDPENLPEDVDPGIKQIIEDYKLPTIHDLSSKNLY